MRRAGPDIKGGFAYRQPRVSSAFELFLLFAFFVGFSRVARVNEKQSPRIMKLLFFITCALVIIAMAFSAHVIDSSEDDSRCDDKSEYCKFMKPNCFDAKYEKLMKTQCRQTCGFC